MKRLLRIIAVLLLLAAIGVGGWWLWTTYGTEESATDTLGGSGIVEADEAAVSPVIAGRVVEVIAEEGSLVSSGTVLFRLDSALLDLQVQQAEAGVRAAEAALNQAKTDEASQAEIDRAQARVEQALAARDMARVQRSYADIAAPFDATVVNVAVSLGENAAPGKTLATVADLSHLYVSVYVPETRIGDITVGKKASITTDSSTRGFSGHVVFIASEAEFTPSNIETKEQRVKLVYEVRLDIDSPGDVLKPGMPVDVDF